MKNLILIFHEPKDNTKSACAELIHRGCTDTYELTDDDVDDARIYTQENMLKKAAYPLSLPPCPKLYVRRNFKCLTHEERVRVIEVIQELYENGFMWKLAEIHAKCWVPGHKSVEGAMSHRYLAHLFEMEMRNINPEVTLPYWVRYKVKNDLNQNFLQLIRKFRKLLKTASILRSHSFGIISGLKAMNRRISA